MILGLPSAIMQTDFKKIAANAANVNVSADISKLLSEFYRHAKRSPIATLGALATAGYLGGRTLSTVGDVTKNLITTTGQSIAQPVVNTLLEPFRTTPPYPYVNPYYPYPYIMPLPYYR